MPCSYASLRTCATVVLSFVALSSVHVSSLLAQDLIPFPNHYLYYENSRLGLGTGLNPLDLSEPTQSCLKSDEPAPRRQGQQTKFDAFLTRSEKEFSKVTGMETSAAVGLYAGNVSGKVKSVSETSFSDNDFVIVIKITTDYGTSGLAEEELKEQYKTIPSNDFFKKCGFQYVSEVHKASVSIVTIKAVGFVARLKESTEQSIGGGASYGPISVAANQRTWSEVSRSARSGNIRINAFLLGKTDVQQLTSLVGDVSDAVNVPGGISNANAQVDIWSRLMNKIGAAIAPTHVETNAAVIESSVSNFSNLRNFNDVTYEDYVRKLDYLAHARELYQQANDLKQEIDLVRLGRSYFNFVFEGMSSPINGTPGAGESEKTEFLNRDAFVRKAIQDIDIAYHNCFNGRPVDCKPINFAPPMPKDPEGNEIQSATPEPFSEWEVEIRRTGGNGATSTGSVARTEARNYSLHDISTVLDTSSVTDVISNVSIIEKNGCALEEIKLVID